MKKILTTSLLFGTLFSFLSSAQGQDLDRDLFPRVIVGISGGLYDSFIKKFEKENLKEPLVGGMAAVELFNHHKQNRALYLAVQYQSFVARKVGSQLIKWNERYMNIGLRYTLITPFIGRPSSLIWFGSGVSVLTLNRKDFRIIERIIFDDNNNAKKIEIDESIIEKWHSKKFYFEVGQIIPFQESLFPVFGIVWNLKYDHGRDEGINLGSVSFNLGFYVSFFY